MAGRRRAGTGSKADPREDDGDDGDDGDDAPEGYAGRCETRRATDPGDARPMNLI